MAALYCYVRRRQRRIHIIQANQVAKQAGLYLVGLYGAYGVNLVEGAISMYREEEIFWLGLLAHVNLNLLGLWMMLIYLRFRVRTGGGGGVADSSATVSMTATIKNKETEQQDVSSVERSATGDRIRGSYKSTTTT